MSFLSEPQPLRLRPVAVYAGICLAWYGLVALLILWQGYPKALLTLAVPAFDRPFSDMRIVLDGIEAAGRGEDVIGAGFQPADYFWIQFPYSTAWLPLKHLGIQGSHTTTFAICLGLGMLAHFAVLAAQNGARPLLGLVMAAFACSPPVMLALERCNPDLLLYLMLAGACCLLAKRSWAALAGAAVLIFGAGMLKFFPFAAAAAILPGQRPRLRRTLFCLFGLATLVFLAFDWGDVKRIGNSGLASSDWCSFGSAVAANSLVEKFTHLTGVVLPAIAPVALRCAGILLLLVFSLRRAMAIRRESPSTNFSSGMSAAGFLAGAGIVTASFIVIRSYNYKFIFLAPVLPTLVQWAQAHDRRGRTARLALITFFLWIWSELNGYAGLLMNIFGSWLFAGCLASLLFAWLLEEAEAWKNGLRPWRASDGISHTSAPGLDG